MPYFTYIGINKTRTVLYTGVTNNLQIRSEQHAEKTNPGFTAKYNVNRIVWYDVFNSPQEAIGAEKRIKGWTRAKKIELIQSKNPQFKDLNRQ